MNIQYKDILFFYWQEYNDEYIRTDKILFKDSLYDDFIISIYLGDSNKIFAYISKDLGELSNIYYTLYGPAFVYDNVTQAKDHIDDFLLNYKRYQKLMNFI